MYSGENIYREREKQGMSAEALSLKAGSVSYTHLTLPTN